MASVNYADEAGLTKANPWDGADSDGVLAAALRASTLQELGGAPHDAGGDDAKVLELRALVRWCEGMVWCSPEVHGTFSAVFKNQVDWMPLSEGAVRPTQGKTLAVMQVEGGSQSFNTVCALRVLGRWMRCVVVPNQASIPRCHAEFAGGALKPGPARDRVVDVVDELFKFTLLVRDQSPYLAARYSEVAAPQSAHETLADEFRAKLEDAGVRLGDLDAATATFVAHCAHPGVARARRQRAAILRSASSAHNGATRTTCATAAAAVSM
ncbi:NADPH-dependent FMN reductase [Aureococcus anophagefferens]|nr:NADPH-dependent FMN reductase [Aureococcus anophagefferens]